MIQVLWIGLSAATSVILGNTLGAGKLDEAEDYAYKSVSYTHLELSEKICKEVLKQGRRGVLAVLGDEEYTYAVPMNYYYCEDNNKIYFHGAREGHKIDAISKHDKVSFCVYDEG